MLVRVIKNWEFPDLHRQTPGGSGIWNGIVYTFEDVENPDVVVVLNHLSKQVRVNCPRDNIWVLMQEPYIPDIFDWMVEGHEQYGRVFTHHRGNNTISTKYVSSHPALPWHVNRTYEELHDQGIPKKEKLLSWITSNLSVFPGHMMRMKFMDELKAACISVDIFGRGIRYIEDKWDGLAPYRYSLAIENSSSQDYWTEKIADCFLSWTIPIYYGCTNLEDYFPSDSFIRIDITRPSEAVEKIIYMMKHDDWSARLPAIEEARRLVLDEYQFFPSVAKAISNYYVDSSNEICDLLPYKQKNRIFRAARRRMRSFARRMLAGG